MRAVKATSCALNLVSNGTLISPRRTVYVTPPPVTVVENSIIRTTETLAPSTVTLDPSIVLVTPAPVTVTLDPTTVVQENTLITTL